MQAVAAKELDAVKAAELFTAYLATCRKDDVALSSLLPGRFLMPGDFAGSPLLTFAPLNLKPDQEFPKGSLGHLMERRYNSYVSKIVRPFFFSHFARLDRQIVLVDALSALNAGPAAVQDLKNALTQVLACFRSRRKLNFFQSSGPPDRPHSFRRNQSRSPASVKP